MIIVAGTLSSWLFYEAMRHRLQREGYNAYIFELPTLGMQDMKLSSSALSALVDKVRARLRATKVDLIELADPLGVDEGSHDHSEFVLIGGRGRAWQARDRDLEPDAGVRGAVRLRTGVPRSVGQDRCAATGQSRIRRDDLAENDWGYVEKAHRGSRMALLGWAGSMLLAHHRGYPACLGIANQAALPGWAAPSIRSDCRPSLPASATSSGSCFPRRSRRAWRRSSTARSHAIPGSCGRYRGLIASAPPLLRLVSCRDPIGSSDVKEHLTMHWPATSSSKMTTHRDPESLRLGSL